jgi:fatty acid amide hydrolase
MGPTAGASQAVAQEALVMIATQTQSKYPRAEEALPLAAAALARQIQAGSVRPSELVEAQIARIQALQPQLNAVVFERFEAARREAREADRRARDGGPLPPLFGVPITLKDNLDLAGAPSTFGVERLRTPVDRDAPVVRRLREAGAIVLAKTNVAQLLLFLETDNPVFGRTANPFSPERSSGGSSGGEAALVATGASVLGFGTDLGGSVRVPAAFCGIAGFKPTAGRAVDGGRFSAPLGQQTIASQVGVLARTVEDLTLGLRIAIGQGDDGRGPLQVAPADLNGLRFAVCEDDGILAPCPAARRAVREASAALSGAGAVRISPELPSRAELFGLFYAIMSADRLAHARATLGSGKIDLRIAALIDAASKPRFAIEWLLRATNRRRTLDVVRCFGDGSAAAYFAAVERVLELRASAEAAMRDVDIVLSPATALPAVRHGATAELGTLGSYTLAWNVLGWPAGVLPWTRVREGEESDRPASRDKRDIAARETERGSAGLPIGIQIAAAPHRDHVALAVMQALEQRKPQVPNG